MGCRSLPFTQPEKPFLSLRYVIIALQDSLLLKYNEFKCFKLPKKGTEKENNDCQIN